MYQSYEPSRDFDRFVGVALEKANKARILGVALPPYVILNPGTTDKMIRVDADNEERFDRVMIWVKGATDYMLGVALERQFVFVRGPLSGMKGTGPQKKAAILAPKGGCDLPVISSNSSSRKPDGAVDLRVAVRDKAVRDDMTLKSYYSGLVEEKFSAESTEKAELNARGKVPDLMSWADNGVFDLPNCTQKYSARAGCVGILAVSPWSFCFELMVAEKTNWKPPEGLERKLLEDFPPDLQRLYPHSMGQKLPRTLRSTGSQALPLVGLGPAVATKRKQDQVTGPSRGRTSSSIISCLSL